MRIPKIISLPWPLLLQINALGKRGQWQQKSHFIFFSKEKQRSHLPTSCKHQLRTRIGELSKGHKFYPQKNIRLTWKKMISIFLGLPQPVSWSVHVGMSAHKHTHAALVVFFMLKLQTIILLQSLSQYNSQARSFGHVLALTILFTYKNLHYFQGLQPSPTSCLMPHPLNMLHFGFLNSSGSG